MLIDKRLADVFLSHYKAIMAFLNSGVEPSSIKAYASLRPLIFEKINEIEKEMVGTVGFEFINAIKSGVFGKYVYLKKYKNGYILKNIETERYYQVSGLTTPLEEIVPEYSVIDTAIIPYANTLVCDGLILSHGIRLGKNMATEIRNGYWVAKRSKELITNASNSF